MEFWCHDVVGSLEPLLPGLHPPSRPRVATIKHWLSDESTGRVRSPRVVTVGLTKADAEQHVISILNDLA